MPSCAAGSGDVGACRFAEAPPAQGLRGAGGGWLDVPHSRWPSTCIRTTDFAYYIVRSMSEIQRIDEVSRANGRLMDCCTHVAFAVLGASLLINQHAAKGTLARRNSGSSGGLESILTA